MRRYLKTIVGLPFWLGVRWLPCGEHVTRYYMYRQLERIVTDATRGTNKTVLSISHSQVLAKYLGIENASIVEANYPEHNAIDLNAFGDGKFDYVISDQVLEHVEGNPQLVFDETLRLLKPGGVAVHTTCFITPIHAWPSDFWRFTPEALKYLARNFSKVLEVGGFGNRGVWVVDFLGLRWTPVPHAKWHPLHIVATKNNSDWPVSTWIVAQK
jgi:SAM-dependent methyltransferase